MKTRLIIDEDSVYEIDEECDEKRKEEDKNKKNAQPLNRTKQHIGRRTAWLRK
ncbi:MAG: hypothetical protein HFI63_09475 [Lachnospiraceae bacterium]|nr:hypothetical protein [Lachnospiraceae bacterium]